MRTTRHQFILKYIKLFSIVLCGYFKIPFDFKWDYWTLLAQGTFISWRKINRDLELKQPKTRGERRRVQESGVVKISWECKGMKIKTTKRKGRQEGKMLFLGPRTAVSPHRTRARAHTHTYGHNKCKHNTWRVSFARSRLATWQIWKPTRPQNCYWNTKHTHEDSDTGAWQHAQTPQSNLSATKKRR